MSSKMHYFIFWALFVLKITTTAVHGSLSGYYTDNGDKTMIQQYLDEEDKSDVQEDLLAFLGLPERPKHRNHRHLSLRKSAPQFLLDIYHRINDVENPDNHLLKSRYKRELNDEENFVTDFDKKAADDSDVIMTFLNKNHHVGEGRHEHGRRLWFDTNDVETDNHLISAELRIYQNPTIGKWAGTGKEFVISVYKILKIDGGNKQLALVNNVNTTSDYHGWLEVNVTEALEQWSYNKKSNKGFYISAHVVNRPGKEIRLDEIGLVNTRGDDEYQPFMIGFFKGPELIKIPKHSRRNKRQTSKKKRNYSPLLESTRETNRFCSIQMLYVDFNDLKWKDWIVAPDGYAAYYCSGECEFPLNTHMNATNHAIVQTLVHLTQPKKVPKACCVPSSLGLLPVLYHQTEENVTLKKYKNMIVKSCGCH